MDKQANFTPYSKAVHRIKWQQGRNGGFTNKQIKMIEHNKMIIDDNILFGYKAGYSNKEIADYRKEAKADLEKLRKHFLGGGKAKFDEATQMYIIDSEEIESVI